MTDLLLKSKYLILTAELCWQIHKAKQLYTRLVRGFVSRVAKFSNIFIIFDIVNVAILAKKKLVGKAKILYFLKRQRSNVKIAPFFITIVVLVIDAFTRFFFCLD